MGLPFLNHRAARKRDQLLAIDMGARTTKAVQLQRKGDGYAVTRFVVLDAPIYEKTLSSELLAEHLKLVVQTLESRARLVTLAVGVSDSLVRHAEMPQMPVGDMRQILKNNSKIYLQQDLPGYVFDCFILATRAPAKPTDKAKLPVGPQKHKVLVAGAKRQLIEEMNAAVRASNLIPDSVVPGLIGPVNAFELAAPQLFSKEVVALVDLGFRNTTICLLQEGELIMSRVVGIGGDRFTNCLAEAMGITYAEAEGIKIGMPNEVRAELEALVKPLARELRASIDFFEHQQDRTISQVFFSGASARSEFIVKTLESELMAPCSTWNPLAGFPTELPPQQQAEVEQVAPQFAVAVGAAAATLC